MRTIRLFLLVCFLFGLLAVSPALQAQEEPGQSPPPPPNSPASFSQERFTRPLVREKPGPAKIDERNFWLWAGISYAGTIADIELTQRCLRAHTCREGNPLLPTNRATIYPLQLGLTTGANLLSYYLKKDQYEYWWLPQVAVSAAHGVGVSFGLRFVW